MFTVWYQYYLLNLLPRLTEHILRITSAFSSNNWAFRFQKNRIQLFPFLKMSEISKVSVVVQRDIFCIRLSNIDHDVYTNSIVKRLTEKKN